MMEMIMGRLVVGMKMMMMMTKMSMVNYV
jgi:hypothetical protein